MAPQTPPTTTFTESHYNKLNNNILQRLGGESVFEYIILGMVERLQQDERLEFIFGNFLPSNLDSLQRTVFKAMLLSSSSTNQQQQQQKDEDTYYYEDVDGFILLRYYSLMVEQGFDETHFDIVVQHFLESLQDAWVEDDVLEEAVGIVKSFRPVFRHGQKLERRRTIQQQQEKNNKEKSSKNKKTSNHDEETSSVCSTTEDSMTVAGQLGGSSGKYLPNFIRPTTLPSAE